jgi:putative transposase
LGISKSKKGHQMREEFRNSENWSKRFLPHYNSGEKFQLVTYRLADSIPQSILKSFQHRKSEGNLGAPHADAGKSLNIEAQKRLFVENNLDRGYGSCLLGKPEIAQKVIENWQYFNNLRYELIAYIVMPNHVHILIKTFADWPLSKVVWTWKRRISKVVSDNNSLKEQFMKFSKPDLNLESSAPKDKKKFVQPKNKNTFSFWHREYWDRFIRDEKHFQKAVDYIHNNPVKAGLVNEPRDWPFSSIHTLTN